MEDQSDKTSNQQNHQPEQQDSEVENQLGGQIKRGEEQAWKEQGNNRPGQPGSKSKPTESDDEWSTINGLKKR